MFSVEIVNFMARVSYDDIDDVQLYMKFEVINADCRALMKDISVYAVFGKMTILTMVLVR